MARSLPENTVDAWTAIELARAGASWIWLPTNPQGASWTGSHPGDVSAVAGRRLLLIENKGIEAQTSIDFGDPRSNQRGFLLSVEEVGLSVLPASAPAPPLGWVFYGLPLRTGPVTGTDWRTFSDWHHLYCPHTLDCAGISPARASIDDLRRIGGSCACHHRRSGVHCIGLNFSPPLTLDWLAYASRIGLAGLPLAGDERRLREQLSGLVDGVREARVEAEPDVDAQNLPTTDADNVLELLQKFAAMTAGRALNRTVGVI